MSKIRVTIADDHRLYAEALKELLNNCREPQIQVIDVAHSGNSLLRSLESVIPDVVLLDLNMPDGDGLTVLPAIKRKFEGVRVIVLTMYDEAKFIKAVHKFRGDGYFLKSNGYPELLKAIHQVMLGEPYFCEGLKVFPKKLESNGDRGFEDEFIIRHNLTPRELEILSLISNAKSNKEIAEELFISDQTVMVHRKNIMRKLSVSNTAGLIKFALDHDLS